MDTIQGDSRVGSRIKRLFKTVFAIEKGEFFLVQGFLLYFTTIGIFYTFGATSGDTLLLSRFGAEAKKLLPWVYVGIAVSSIMITWIYDVIQTRIPRVRLLIITYSVLAASVLVLRIVLGRVDHPLVYFGLVVWLEACALISIMLFFSFAGDYFTAFDARRLYGYISGGLALGTVIAGLSTRFIVALIGVANMLFLVIALQGMCAVWVLIIYLYRKPDSHQDVSQQDTETVPLHSVFANRYILQLLLVLVAAFACFRLVEFQFQIKAASVMRNEKLASFFGGFYTYVGIAQMGIQFLIVGFILRKLGPIKGLLILPFLLLISSVASAFYSHVLIVWASINFVRVSLSETLDMPARELLFLPLPKRLRLRTQALFSGALIPLGSGIGGLLILCLVTIVSKLSTFNYITMGITAAYVLFIVLLNPQYRTMLTKSLSSHEFSPADLSYLQQNQEVDETIDKLLASDNTEQLALTLGLLKHRPVGRHIERIRRLVAFNNEYVAMKAIGFISRHGNQEDINAIQRALCDKRLRVRSRAVIAYARIFRENALQYLRQCIHESNIEVRSSALVGMIRYGGFQGALVAYPELKRYLRSSRAVDKITAIRVMAQTKDKSTRTVLKQLLDDPSLAVQKAVIRTGKVLRIAELVSPLLDRLNDPRLQMVVMSTLAAMPVETSKNIINRIHRVEENDINGYCRMLMQTGNSDTAPDMLDIIAGKYSLTVKVACGHVLRSIVNRTATEICLPDQAYPAVEKHFDELIFVNRARLECGQCSDFIDQFFWDRYLLLTDLILSLLHATHHVRHIDQIERNLVNPSKHLRANALELLEINLPSSIGRRCRQFFDSLVTQETPVSNRLSPETRRKLLQNDRWLKTITLYYTKHFEKKQEEVDMNANERSLLDLITTTSFLKGVKLFREVPSEYLIKLADLSETKEYYEGETLVKEGDPGDALFLIEKGEVSVRKGTNEITKMGSGECIGEMALLDGEPRSATCVVIEDSVILKINESDFSMIIESQPQIGKALLSTLARRLRAMT